MSNITKNAMSLIKAACFSDPEKVIGLAIKHNPEIEDVISETRKAKGPLSGVAAIAVRLALDDKNKEVAEMNIICFSTGL